MAATKCDVTALTEIVDRCFDLAMDNRLTEAQCTKYSCSARSCEAVCST